MNRRNGIKILFLTHYFPPEGNAPASRTYETCKRWVRDGAEVTVLTCAPNAPSGVLYPGYRNRLFQSEMIDGIRVLRVWTYLAANKGRALRILNYLSYLLSATLAGLFVRRPDIVIATSPQFFCGWAGVLLQKFRRLPFILEVRDIWPESIAAVGAMKGQAAIKFLEVMERQMYSSAWHIVTVGEGYKVQLQARGVPAKKCSVVTNGVDTEVFESDTDGDSIRTLHALQGKFVCSYIGTIGMACGLEVVLKAAKLLRERGDSNVHFLLVGDGASREELERRAKADGLDNVTFTGRRDKKLMPSYLAATDVCLVHLKRQPLFTTVLPSKIFEAAAMEKPIILGVEGFAANLIRDAGAGICIEPENAGQLVDALSRLEADPAASAEMGRAGCLYVRSHFDRDRLSSEYLKLVRNVASSREPKGLPAKSPARGIPASMERSST